MKKLLLGDCLEQMKQIPDGSVDMICCDPPYGTTACKWDAVIPFEPMWAAVKRVLKKNGAAVFTASQPFTSALVMSNVKMFRYQWVWEKPNGSNQTMAKAQPLRVHEDILVFCDSPAHNMAKIRCPYNPQGLVEYGKQTKQGTKVSDNLGEGRTRKSSYIQEFTNYPRSILKYSQDTPRLHPTQKPVALCEYLIRTYTNEGETVLDFTMGSGTTGVAAINTGRNFWGIERDPDYFAIAKQRILAAELEGLL